MDTIDLRRITAADDWEGRNCAEPWTDPDWWVAPKIQGPNNAKARRAEARDDARSLCDQCPAAVQCLLLAALRRDTTMIAAGLFGAELKAAFKALAAGADPADLIGGAQ